MTEAERIAEFEQAVRGARDFRSASLIVSGWLIANTWQANHPNFMPEVLDRTRRIRGGLK